MIWLLGSFLIRHLRRLGGPVACALGWHTWQRQGFSAVGLLQVQNLRCQRCGAERIKDTTGRALRALSRMINRPRGHNGSVQ